VPRCPGGLLPSSRKSETWPNTSWSFHFSFFPEIYAFFKLARFFISRKRCFFHHFSGIKNLYFSWTAYDSNDSMMCLENLLSFWLGIVHKFLEFFLSGTQKIRMHINLIYWVIYWPNLENIYTTIIIYF
jgi:hypothetical protein